MKCWNWPFHLWIGFSGVCDKAASETLSRPSVCVRETWDDKQSCPLLFITISRILSLCLICFSVLMFHFSQLLISSLWSDFMLCIDYSREEFDPFLEKKKTKIHVLSQIFVSVWASLMSFNLKLRHCLNSISFCLPSWATGTLLCSSNFWSQDLSVYKLKKGCVPLEGSSPKAALLWICRALVLSSVAQNSWWCCCLHPWCTAVCEKPCTHQKAGEEHSPDSCA